MHKPGRMPLSEGSFPANRRSELMQTMRPAPLSPCRAAAQFNHRPPLDAAIASCLHFGGLRRRASEAGRWLAIPMKKTILIFLLLPLLATGAATNESEVAKTLGYKGSSKATVGPYQLHYAKDGSKELMLLAKGNADVMSIVSGQGTDVFLDGLPFIHFDRNADGSLTNLSMNIFDKNGHNVVSMIDTNVDGEWDLKIDYVLTKVFIRKGGQWVERERRQLGAAPNGGPTTPFTNSAGPEEGRHR